MSKQAAPTEANETLRLEAFSDGVFAIAITLLVLEIRLPAGTNPEQPGSLINHLLGLWPTYIAYVTSFITIGIMWMNHHAMFKMIRKVDRPLLLLNALLLMVITFLNFPTVVLAEYLQQPDANVAVLLYTGTLFVTGVLFNSLWSHAAHDHRLLDPALDRLHTRQLSRQYLTGTLLYLVAFLTGFVSVPLSIILCLGLGIFFALPLRRFKG